MKTHHNQSNTWKTQDISINKTAQDTIQTTKSSKKQLYITKTITNTQQYETRATTSMHKKQNTQ